MKNQSNNVIQFNNYKNRKSSNRNVPLIVILLFLVIAIWGNFHISTADLFDFFSRIYINAIALFILLIISAKKNQNENKRQIELLSNNSIELTPKQFFQMRRMKVIGRNGTYMSTQHEFEGVYILFNETKNMYYVGQSKNVMNRINQHFTGHGNGDVYADYKYGDSFKIRTIRLGGSGFTTLNSLEKRTISAYNAFSRGYNKTRGNR